MKQHDNISFRKNFVSEKSRIPLLLTVLFVVVAIPLLWYITTYFGNLIITSRDTHVRTQTHSSTTDHVIVEFSSQNASDDIDAIEHDIKNTNLDAIQSI
jgi:hypothetical protein